MGDAAKIRAKGVRKKTDSSLPFDPAIVICRTFAPLGKTGSLDAWENRKTASSSRSQAARCV